jgi:hypothetical protein
MLNDLTRWSLGRGNPPVPSRWQATRLACGCPMEGSAGPTSIPLLNRTSTPTTRTDQQPKRQWKVGFAIAPTTPGTDTASTAASRADLL